MQKLLVGLAALALMTGGAVADGLSHRGSIKDTDQPFSWRGFYAGLHAGLATGNTQGEVKGHDHYGHPFSIQTDYELDGALYGAQIGWLGQWGNVVAGIEGTYSGSSVQGSTACLIALECQRSVDWIATTVGRAGLAYGRVLVYGLAGVAWADVDTDVRIVGSPLLSGSETHVGWTAGFGFEWAFSDRVSARIEYAHIDLGDETTQLNGQYFTVKDKVELEMDTIRLGVNVKLGH